jgi:hypothetical protein
VLVATIFETLATATATATAAVVRIARAMPIFEMSAMLPVVFAFA